MLSGRVAVVTGGAIGIGRAVVLRLAKEGAKVVVADINSELGEETVQLVKAQNCEGDAIFQSTDVRSEDNVKVLMDFTVEKFGRLDILVNNAVKFVFGHLGEPGTGSKTGTDKSVSEEEWLDILNVNVLGYARCMKHAIRHMKNNELTENIYENDQKQGKSIINAGSRGAICNVASVSSFIAQSEFVPYNTSKGAIAQLTRCSAMDQAKDKIRVNGICPGTVETPGSYGHMKCIGLGIEEGRKVFADSNLLKRQGAPEEIANGVNFLVSDESSFMTGAFIVIDGGGTI
jgi:NAD(P)-dependent dehydrogenase (short-subunit alcohol dehydrogenase family)|eukprot:g4535.t1